MVSSSFRLALLFVVVHAKLRAASPPFILPGLPWPQGLQGHDDENYPAKLLQADASPEPALIERYKVLATMRPGIRRYNMFWNSFEVSPSRDAAFACPPEAVAIPATELQRVAQGYHRFHCYAKTRLAQFDTIFDLDSDIGAQSAAILYSAPAFYRHPNCTGFVFGKDVIKGGCAPMDAHMDDYEDYVLMLARRYTERGLKHFVVWNEVASAGWMDMSPFIPNRAGPNGSFPLTDAQFTLWVAKYADLVARTWSAIRRVGLSDGAVAWTSNDRLWERPRQREGQPLHTGVKPFLDRLWPMLAKANVTFGTAVHPYDDGNPMHAHEFAPGHHPQVRSGWAYTFATLDRVAAYSASQLAKYRPDIYPRGDGKPFTLLFASEQGWPYPNCCADDIRARNICYAHALGLSVPQLVAITHNFFHDDPQGSEQGGQDYGLIPGNVSANLSNGDGHPTFEAYASTAAQVFGAHDEHYCCERWFMGCKSRHVHGTFDPVEVTSGARNATVQLHGWAWDDGAAKAGSEPISVRVSVDGTSLATVLANVSRPDIEIMGAAPTANHGFLYSLPLAVPHTQMHRYTIAVSSARDSAALDQSPRCVCVEPDGRAAVCPC